MRISDIYAQIRTPKSYCARPAATFGLLPIRRLLLAPAHTLAVTSLSAHKNKPAPIPSRRTNDDGFLRTHALTWTRMCRSVHLVFQINVQPSLPCFSPRRQDSDTPD
ncbi:hypothetical protein HGRIS_013622 [Hohenbuehelia grisea]|uniref:Uncharacterized protein n=1 Tax=Hohenbuehelia grisea TaxID=104357 RepID=A0ABR3IVX2_9AGAR